MNRHIVHKWNAEPHWPPCKSVLLTISPFFSCYQDFTEVHCKCIVIQDWQITRATRETQNNLNVYVNRANRPTIISMQFIMRLWLRICLSDRLFHSVLKCIPNAIGESSENYLKKIVMWLPDTRTYYTISCKRLWLEPRQRPSYYTRKIAFNYRPSRFNHTY